MGTNHGKGFINDPETPWPGLIHRMVDEGHQVASHTWSHQNLTELHETEVKKQMYYNEIALADILGFFPTYMRPPHSMSDERTDSILADLGYHIIYYNINTLAYEYLTPETIQMSKDIWDEDSERVHDDSRSVLLVEHDPIEQTVHNLTRYILDSIQEKGWKPVTVGECLGDPKELWYRAA